MPDEPVAAFAAAPNIRISLNPLVKAASSLLLLIAQIRENRSQMDASALRRYALDEIRRFEEEAGNARIANDVVISARYALCASLDEAVLSTPWGNQSEWAHHSLLVALHREASGGEKFFDVLERISQDPERYLDLMELLYVCLAFGFSGKFHVQERGEDRLRAVQQQLYRAIRQARGAIEPELSVLWRGLDDRASPLIRYVPWWVLGAAALAILAVAFTTYLTSLSGLAAPVQAELARVGLADFSPRVVAPAPGPTLKQLLADDQRVGAMKVEENDNRTVITLLAPDLFPSGSATVNPAYTAALQRLTAALNKVPGKVMVVGHTDDQRVRSLEYKDNFALSRARAVAVEEILQQGIDNRARLSKMGVGSLEPRYRPETDPQNRARNRRVEIIHVRGS